MWPWAVQYIDNCKDEQEANQVFTFLQTQVCYLGGRILPPSPAKPEWKTQTFHEDCGEVNARHLPDGCLRVIVPPAHQKFLKGMKT